MRTFAANLVNHITQFTIEEMYSGFSVEIFLSGGKGEKGKEGGFGW